MNGRPTNEAAIEQIRARFGREAIAEREAEKLHAPQAPRRGGITTREAAKLITRIFEERIKK